MNLSDLLKEALQTSAFMQESKQHDQLIQRLYRIYENSQTKTTVANKTALYDLNNLLLELSRLSIELKNILNILILCARVSCGQETSLSKTVEGIEKFRLPSPSKSWLWTKSANKTFIEGYNKLLAHSQEFVSESLYRSTASSSASQLPTVSPEAALPTPTQPIAISAPAATSSLFNIQKLLNFNLSRFSPNLQKSPDELESYRQKINELTLENEALKAKLSEQASKPFKENEYFASSKDDLDFIQSSDLDKIISFRQSNYEFTQRHQRLQIAIKLAMANPSNTNQLPNLAQELIDCESLYNTCFPVYEALFDKDLSYSEAIGTENWSQIIDYSSNILTSFYGLSKSKPQSQGLEFSESQESTFKKYFDHYDKVITFKKLKAEFHEEIIKRAENVCNEVVKNLMIHKDFILREVGDVPINLNVIDKICREKREKEVKQNQSVAKLPAAPAAEERRPAAMKAI